MTNNKKKGQVKELLCQKELEKEGWEVVFRSHTIKQGPIFKGYDFADCIDVVAVKKITREWLFVSCTHKGNEIVRINKLRNFRIDHGLQNMYFEVWVWNKSKWCGRGKNRKWVNAHWEKILV